MYSISIGKEQKDSRVKQSVECCKISQGKYFYSYDPYEFFISYWLQTSAVKYEIFNETGIEIKGLLLTVDCWLSLSLRKLIAIKYSK
jgi:hypothetical protein